jgi:hypothetical protein
MIKARMKSCSCKKLNSNNDFGEIWFLIDSKTKLRLYYYPKLHALGVEVSIPHFLFGNNIKILSGNDLKNFKTLITDIVRSTFHMPVNNIDDWHVTRLDFFIQKDFEKFEDALEVISVLKKVKFPYSNYDFGSESISTDFQGNNSRKKHATIYSAYPTSIHQGNHSYVINAYIKTFDQNNSYEKENYSVRFELQYKRPGIYSLVRRKQSPFNSTTVKEMLTPEAAQYIFKYDLKYLKIDQPILNYNSLYSKIRKSFSIAKASNIISEVKLLNAGKNMRCSRKSFNNYLNDLKKIKVSPYSTKRNTINFNTFKIAMNESSILDYCNISVSPNSFISKTGTVFFSINISEFRFYKNYNYNITQNRII